ncbi:oxygen-independent coproporphyrinogen III oxidase, partial [Nereida sp. MMG025]|uniref:oxygen-independent coproporphyrinogen III oxidase n=1 Tax=Nereida sp. MMG025 TaxID=2909981 RepID=UPI001F025BFA
MTTMTQLSRLGLFDARVPRYTSYPTAPHFAGGVDASLFKTWISALPEGDRISLYIHVPFCRRLCWFCACRTQGTQTLGPVAAYVETLKEELRLLAATLPSGIKLSRLHWGGGTPTLLSAGMMRDLAQAIFAVAPLADDAEFSVEIDPNEIDAERIAVLAEAGMNRASIGVQDFDPQIQECIGREQSYDVTKEAADMLRAAGIRSLNADILYGLPHQTNEKIADSVQMLLSLAPDRVALYGYAHVPWMARRQGMIPSDALPTPQERLGLFETAQQLFDWDGYKTIGIDHFATPTDGLSVAQAAGKLKRNFQGYTDDPSPTLIGLGASAISKFRQGFAQHVSATSKYTSSVRDGIFATHRGHVFSTDDLLRARIIEALMCDFEVNADELARDFGLTAAGFKSICTPALDRFGDTLDFNAARLAIPERTRPLTRLIASAFDAYDMAAA